jgi:hypothetical protein
MKKWKKILLWTGITAGTLIAILLIVAAYYAWTTGIRLEQKLAALKAAGEPICLADLARKPIPPQQNGATYLRRAKADLYAVDKATADLKYNEEEGGFLAEDLPHLEEILNTYPNIYPLLEQAAACPDFDMQWDFTLLPSKFLEKYLDDIYLFRAPARYLDARIQILLSKGKSDEALQSVILMLRLTRQIEREPLLMSYLVTRAITGIAVKCANGVLQAGPVNDQARAALDAELSLHDSLDSARTVLKAERAYILDCFRHEQPHPWILSNFWQISTLDMYEEFLNYSLSPYSAWAAKENAKQAKPKSTVNVFGELLRPAFRAALIVAYRTEAQVRAIRIINALQKKAPVDGNKAPTMAELGLPDDVGIDPYNGEAMHIKKLPQGWLVYSVGENLKDDGGNFKCGKDGQPLDVGFGPKIPSKE